MNEIRVVDETVLELSECRWFLGWRPFLDGLRRGVGPLRTYNGLRFDGFCLGGLDSLQVYLLHFLQLKVGLRVSASALAELTQLVVLVKVELRTLQVLIDVLAEHFFEVTVVHVPLLLLCTHLTLAQIVQVASAFTLLRSLVSLVT